MLVNYNGQYYAADALPIPATHLGLRYGLGLFETMRWTGGEIPLLSGHLKRLRAGLEWLNIAAPNDFFTEIVPFEIQNTVKRNQLLGDVRIRLQVSAVPVEENAWKADFRIEVSRINPLVFNKLGLKIGIAENNFFGGEWPLSGFKTGSYIPFLMAQQEAKARGVDELLVFNNKGRIGEASTSNVFWMQNGVFYTPPLTENIVAGVARARLLEVLSVSGYTVIEKFLLVQDLPQLDSLFLTNAVQGIRWVACCNNWHYSSGPAENLFNMIFALSSS